MSTERVDPRYSDIDRWPTEQALEAMLEGQRAAIDAVGTRTGEIARAADEAAARLGSAGRLGYAGAGTSGRIGVQDGVELTPTFGWPEERLLCFLAGGSDAMMRAVEGAEDDADAGRAAAEAAAVTPGDVIIGVAASGRTPFTVAVLEAARARGALTIAVANNADTPLLAAAEHPILLDTGSEAIAGSTRMKAGTAQKAALNLLSTAIMLRQGLVLQGLMVNMRVSNAKLRRRALAMVADVAQVAEPRAEAALDAAAGDIRAAVLIARGLSPEAARDRLTHAGRDFRTLLAELDR